jgi:phosphopantothenoylcysteine decarboxylase/phosphopantothenate--cysteine ligase
MELTSLKSSESKCQPLKGRSILLGVCGSVSAYKATLLARLLVKSGASVRACFSSSASHFIGPETFRGITGLVPYSESYRGDQSLGAEPHITIAEQADLFVIYPATANTIAKLAGGLADDPVTLTALAFKGEKIVSPAMATEMWENEKTTENCHTLKHSGYHFIGPASGELASGKSGAGRLVEPEDIFESIKSRLGKNDGLLNGRKIVISAGGTKEAIDPVRFIGNHSSGKMGHALAEAARDMGADVSLVTTIPNFQSSDIEVHLVRSALEMKEKIDSLSSGKEILIMAAAVADFRPAKALSDKYKKDSQKEPPIIELIENPDIVKTAKIPLKVAFAAETSDLEANAKLKLSKKGVDLVVANDVTLNSFGSDNNQVTIFSKTGEKTLLPESDKYCLANSILELISQEFRNQAK